MSDIAVSETANMDSLVGQVADEFLERLERGEDPQVEEYAEQHPQIAAILGQVLPALRVMRSTLLRSTTSRTQSPTSPGDLGEGAVGQLGDYRILREVGRGGMGVVYEAEQVSLGRRVALKVLPFAAAVEPRQLQRFKQEAQAAAHLLHQNIVAVYAVGCERGVHYYAMQFVDGQSLAALTAELAHQTPQPNDRPSPTTPPCPAAETVSEPIGRMLTERTSGSPNFFRSVAQLGVQAAEALEYAHQQGIVHRDVKPANLLVDGRGQLWVADFGLARFHREVGLTQSGDVVGTLRYISPEQALGPHALVDQRTDVYGLGATLYELLTRRPIHDGHDRNALLRQIERDEPVSVRKRNPAVPTELETIIHKALAHHPADRYSTAQELADDLRRFLEDKPIHAKRPNLLQRFAKWRRRHPGVVRAAAILLVAGVAALSVGTAVIWREKENAKLAQAQSEVERRRADVRYRLARLAPDDIYTNVIQNWLIETEVMRKRLTRKEQKTVAHELLLKALAYYQEQATSAGNDSETRLEKAMAYRRIGEVQQKLRRPQEAERAYRQAIALFDGLAMEFPEIPDYGLNLALSIDGLARLLVDGGHRHTDAVQAYRQASVLAGRLAESFPDVPDASLLQALALTGLGKLMRDTRRYPEAEQNYGEAIELLERLAAEDPRKVEYRGNLGRALHGLAQVRIDQANLEAARQLLLDAIRHQETALKSNSKYPDYRQGITAHFQELFGVLFQMGKHEEAAQSAELFADLLPERGCDASAAVQVLNMCVHLAAKDSTRPSSERIEVRQRYIDRARNLFQEAVRRSAGDPDVQALLAWQRAMMPYEWIHDPAKGVELAQEAVKQRATEPALWTTLGLARYRTGDAAGAVADLTEAVRLGDGGKVRDWLYLALANNKLGRIEEARKWYERAQEVELNDAPGDWELKNLRAEAAAAFAQAVE